MNERLYGFIIFAAIAALLALLGWGLSRIRVRSEANQAETRVKKPPYTYRVDHNLNDLEPLVSSYDAVTGALLTPMNWHTLDPMSLEVYTHYGRPFRVVAVNALGTTHRCTFIPQEENP